MAASSYWNDGSALFPSYEEYLESQAADIEAKALLLQARIRGFLYRSHKRSASEPKTRCLTRASPIGRGEEPRSNVKSNITSHNQTSSRNDSVAQSLKSNRNGDDVKLVDPDFAEKRVDDLPRAWIATYTADGIPFFVDTVTRTSTWVHPRQDDASVLFGPAFNLFWVWKQYIARSKSMSPDNELRIPTIGELAVYHCAFQDRNDPYNMDRWWRELDIHSSSRSLCEVCCHIDFGSLLHTMTGWGYTDDIMLGSLRSITKKTYCAFCRLIVRSVSPRIDELVRTLDKNASVVRCSLIRSQEWMEFTSKIRVLYIDFKLPEQHNLQHDFGLRRIHQVLQNKEKPPEQRHNDSRLVKNETDIELVKSWVKICDQQHKSALCETGHLEPSFGPLEATDIHDKSTRINLSCEPLPLTNNSLPLTLIDVQYGFLVQVKPDVRYLALSYVWGGPQPFQNTRSKHAHLQQPGAISAENAAIPQTIRDAIKLVKMLGERYLWVDSLCIIQDDTSDKMKQIANMGNIYSQAVMTIVAAHGSSCHAGLPGVRQGSRSTFQYVEKVQGMLLANELNYIYGDVQDSVWNTRGWTYQERELSKRCLIFTESCVYFSCNQMVCKEDSGLRDVSLVHEKSKRIRAEYHPAWNNYRRAVQKITKRSFTNQEDIVNAFEGIINLLQPAFKCDFIFGLPETELDVALLWQPRSAIRRRINEKTKEPMFPSWSWAGWTGEIDYVWTKHVLDDLSRIKWQIQNSATQEYLTSDELRAPRSGKHGAWVYVEGNSVWGTPYYYEPDHPQMWCLHPTAAKEDRLPHRLLLPNTHVLRFKAMTATFRIAIKPHTLNSFDYDTLSSCTPGHHVICPIEIMSADNFVAGTVYIPAHLMQTLKSEPREFICLSRRRGFYADASGNGVYKHFQGYHTYPNPSDDFENVPTRPILYPGRRAMHQTHDKYDHARYNDCKPWPLYNVMLIERQCDLAFRVAVGTVHMTAFLQARPVEMLISLA